MRSALVRDQQIFTPNLPTTPQKTQQQLCPPQAIPYKATTDPENDHRLVEHTIETTPMRSFVGPILCLWREIKDLNHKPQFGRQFLQFTAPQPHTVTIAAATTIGADQQPVNHS
jgi:hypothetical protein